MARPEPSYRPQGGGQRRQLALLRDSPIWQTLATRANKPRIVRIPRVRSGNHLAIRNVPVSIRVIRGVGCRNVPARVARRAGAGYKSRTVDMFPAPGD